MCRYCKTTLLISMLLWSASAAAADWYAVAASPSVGIFVDKSSLQKKGAVVRFWQWQFFARRIGTTDSAKTKVAIDCVAKKRKTEYMIAITEIDTVQKEGKIDEPFQPIVDDTLEANVFGAVCNNRFSGQGQPTVNVNDVRNFMFFSFNK